MAIKSMYIIFVQSLKKNNILIFINSRVYTFHYFESFEGRIETSQPQACGLQELMVHNLWVLLDSWSSPKKKTAQFNPSSFIFTLTNPHGMLTQLGEIIKPSLGNQDTIKPSNELLTQSSQFNQFLQNT